MEPTDLTIDMLKGIRDETRKTNEGLQQTNEELRKLGTEVRKTNERIDDLRSELTGKIGGLDDRMTAMEMRVATELVAVAGAVREVRDLLREDRALRGARGRS